MQAERELSPLAQSRMAEMLPGLVGAVRWRRRRRRAAQGVVLAAMVWLSVLIWPDGGAAPQPVPPGPGPVRASVCEVVGDVPGVLERYRAKPVVRDEWFVGDEELQRFLSEGDRPSGLVRVGSRVMVVGSAIDPFPKGEAE